MSDPREPRRELIDGVWVYTYDLDTEIEDMDDDVLMEQDNDYAAERMAEQFDEGE